MKEKKKRGEPSYRLRIMLILSIALGVVILVAISTSRQISRSEIVFNQATEYDYAAIFVFGLSFDIDTPAISEPLPQTGYDAVDETIEISVDGIAVPRPQISTGDYGTDVAIIGHVNGTPVMITTNNMRVFFQIPAPLSIGQHTVSVRFASNNGTVYTDQWTFTVLEVESRDYRRLQLHWDSFAEYIFRRRVGAQP